MARERVSRWKADQDKQRSGEPTQAVNQPGGSSHNFRSDAQVVNIHQDASKPPNVLSTVVYQAQFNQPIHESTTQKMHHEVNHNKEVRLQDNVRVKFLSKETLAARSSDMKNLPAFSGIAKEWPVFIRQFEQSTELCQYTDVDNIIRLRNSLQGSARVPPLI